METIAVVGVIGVVAVGIPYPYSISLKWRQTQNYGTKPVKSYITMVCGYTEKKLEATEGSGEKNDASLGLIHKGQTIICQARKITPVMSCTISRCPNWGS